MIPCSEIFNDTKTGSNRSKQVFALCFSLHKIALQVYEIEATWLKEDENFKKPRAEEIDIVGLKMFFNCNVEEICSNITPHGIDGISIEMDTKDGFGWFSFPRTKVTDFKL